MQNAAFITPGCQMVDVFSLQIRKRKKLLWTESHLSELTVYCSPLQTQKDMIQAQRGRVLVSGSTQYAPEKSINLPNLPPLTPQQAWECSVHSRTE